MARIYITYWHDKRQIHDVIRLITKTESNRIEPKTREISLSLSHSLDLILSLCLIRLVRYLFPCQCDVILFRWCYHQSVFVSNIDINFLNALKIVPFFKWNHLQSKWWNWCILLTLEFRLTTKLAINFIYIWFKLQLSWKSNERPSTVVVADADAILADIHIRIHTHYVHTLYQRAQEKWQSESNRQHKSLRSIWFI